jgi:4-aminobutyrate aminotransferase/(S)-3-amino-2-methylpropionate transaminase
MTKTETLLAARQKNLPRGVATAHPIVAERAQGALIWDVEGNEYLDFVGGIGVLNVGHNHARVVSAVQEQLTKLSHTAFQVVAYEPYIRLAERLNKAVGKGADYKSIFLTTGAEAVENAVKIARAYTNRPAIISFTGGFHGRTLLGTTLTGISEPYKQNFGPLAPAIYHSLYPDTYRGVTTEIALAALETFFATVLAPSQVAAFIIEPVQGDGGFVEAPVEFLQKLRELATKHGIVLIMDEIQTGFGRTGDLFAFEHSGIAPDLLTVAKSLAGGLPLSGVVGKAEIMDAPTPGGLGGTYGGNALACAAANAVLDALEEDKLIEAGRAIGAKMQIALEAMKAKYPAIGCVRGRGLMLGLTFVKNQDPKQPDADLPQKLVEAALKKGLLIIKCGIHRDTVRFLAPLVTTEAQLDFAMGVVESCLAELTA